MTTLNLNQAAPATPSEEQVRKVLAEAVRSRNLLNNQDFQWWIGKLEEGVEKHVHKLVWANEEPTKYHERRGMIQSIRKALKELKLKADQVEELEERVKLYDRQSEPVARGA